MQKKVSSKVTAIVVSLALGAMLFTSGCTIFKKKAPSAPAQLPATTQPQVQPVEPGTSSRNTPIVRAAAKVGPAVVGITVKTKVLIQDFFGMQEREREGTGSGVIYRKDGYIATNWHVVQNAKKITVILADGKSYEGKVLGTDKTTDLAVVKIKADNLPVAPLGTSSDLMVGEPAIAIGNPFGMDRSVTAGIISATSRSLNLGDRKMKVIQTDAPINPGNSGGPLVNADGFVIGINSSKLMGKGDIPAEGMGFAVPIDEAKQIITQLEQKGKVERPSLGVSVIDGATAQKYGLPIDLRGGIMVMKVAENSPAYKAGIRANDIIVKIQGQKVTKFGDLKEFLDKCKVGDSITVTVLRGDSEVELTAQLTDLRKE